MARYHRVRERAAGSERRGREEFDGHLMDVNADLDGGAIAVRKFLNEIDTPK